MESNSWGLKKSFKVSYSVPINSPGKDCDKLFSSALVENLRGPHQLPWALARTTHPSKTCVGPGGRLYFHWPHVLKKKKKKGSARLGSWMPDSPATMLPSDSKVQALAQKLLPFILHAILCPFPTSITVFTLVGCYRLSLLSSPDSD